jgi:VIT1/CCC1 family predicted Fe2+/Mn2+ transporter
MSSQKDEIERLRRIREQQLRARDPLSKQKKSGQKITTRRRQQRQTFSFRDLLDVPYQVKGAIIGALIGVTFWLALPLVVTASWTDVAGLLSILFLTILGVIIGQAIDLREEIKDLIE